MDGDRFFRELTLRICSSLDLEKALRSAFPLVAEHFPVDDVYIDVLDPELGAIRRIAHASAEEAGSGGTAVTQPPPVIPLSPALWAWVEGLRGPVLLDEAGSDEMRAVVKLEGDSDLALPLRVEGQLLGFVILRAAGAGRYTPAHAELLASVSDPFAIALSNTLAHRELLRFRDELLDDKRFLARELLHVHADGVVGAATGLRQVMELVGRAAPLGSTVLLLGETGVGKEVIASALHDASPRRDGPFIKVNCGAIPEGLVDSELFGHEAGAFTGARGVRRGRFERAHGGSIFLDEVGDLPPPAQVRLLRVLQSRELERVGGTRSIAVDIRVIAATHRDLQRMVAEGRFREDLFFRLNVFPIEIPPLRQRPGDVPALVRHFVELKCRELGCAPPPALAPGAMARLQGHPWPGNVRELENLVERELIHGLGSGRPLSFDEVEGPGERRGAGGGEASLPLPLAEATAAHIGRVLAMTGGKIHGPGGAAEVLGVNASTLRNRMRRLGVAFGRKARR